MHQEFKKKRQSHHFLWVYLNGVIQHVEISISTQSYRSRFAPLVVNEVRPLVRDRMNDMEF